MLLWPGTEDGEWLGSMPGAREELLRYRRRNIRRVFGSDLDTARCVLDHMLYGSFAMATELRMRFDPDYCDGMLGYDVIEDLRAEGRNRRDFQRAQGFVRQASGRLETLDRFCKESRPELLSAPGSEDLRIARLAVHVNRGGLHELLDQWQGQDSGGVTESINRELNDAIASKDICTRRLLAVRMHHELTRLSRQGYSHLVETLGYGPERPTKAAASEVPTSQKAETFANAECGDC